MKKGFTLIELLAVIVILAIIAIIATPIVLNIIDDSKKNASLRSAEMYLNAVEYAIADIVTNKGGLREGNYYITEEGDLCAIEKTTNSSCGEENLIEIKMNGEKPKSGRIYVQGSKINTAEMLLSEKTIEKTEKGNLILKEENKEEKSVCTLESDTGEEGITPGDKYTCEVKSGTNYTFYVLSSNEDGTHNLIMDRNLSTAVIEWSSDEDYGCEEDDYYCAKADKGPITAMNYLYNQTKDWVNVPNIVVNYTDEGNTYGSIITTNNITQITMKDGTVVKVLDDKDGYTNLKARIPIKNEIQEYDGTNGYLFNNLHVDWCRDDNGNDVDCDIATEVVGGVHQSGMTHIKDVWGYWTLSSYNYGPNYSHISAGAWYIYYSGGYMTYMVNGLTDYMGVRAVITVKL